MIGVAGDGGDSPVIPWRLVAGVMIHFIAPAYLLALGIAWLVDGPSGATLETFLRFALALSWRFLIAYALLTIVAVAAARLLDPPLRASRARRLARDPEEPARRSARELTAAIRRLDLLPTGQTQPRLARAITTVREAGWHHDDERYRRLSADLSEAATAFATAAASASPEKRREIVELAIQAIEQIGAALDALAAERSRLDEGDARTVARYIDLRYGPNNSPDLAGPADGRGVKS
jgi:hypothetical protein